MIKICRSYLFSTRWPISTIIRSSNFYSLKSDNSQSESQDPGSVVSIDLKSENYRSQLELFDKHVNFLLQSFESLFWKPLDHESFLDTKWFDVRVSLMREKVFDMPIRYRDNQNLHKRSLAEQRLLAEFDRKKKSQLAEEVTKNSLIFQRAFEQYIFANGQNLDNDLELLMDFWMQFSYIPTKDMILQLTEFIHKNRTRHQRYEIIDYGVSENKLADRAKITKNGKYMMPNPDYNDEELSRIGDRVARINKQEALFGRLLKDRKFRYVIDGLNVLHASHCKLQEFSLLDNIIKKLTDKKDDQGCILVVLRKRTSEKFSGEIQALKNRHECVDVCLLERDVDRLDDDFLIYSGLKSGRECQIVSNDEFDQFLGASANESRLFSLWLEKRRIGFKFDKETGCLEFKHPSGYEIRTQKLAEFTWLVPYFNASPSKSSRFVAGSFNVPKECLYIRKIKC